MLTSYVKTDNLVICKCDMIVFCNKISKDAKILGEVDITMIEQNCALMNQDYILCDDVLRIVYKEKVKGIKIGYLEVDYNEYILLKSMDQFKQRIIVCTIFILFLIDLILYARYIL